MKPFNLEAALRGDKVVTMDERKVTDIHYFKSYVHEQKLIAIVDGKKLHFDDNGKYLYYGFPSINDLCMAPTKKKGWINIYKENDGSDYVGSEVYYDPQDAMSNLEKTIHKCSSYEEGGFTKFSSGIEKVKLFKTIKIEWEE